MSGDGWLPAFLIIILTVALVASWQVIPRRRPRPSSAPARLNLTAGRSRLLVATILVFVNAVGGLWLIPWAISLRTIGPAAVWPAILLLGLSSLATVYGLRDWIESE